MPRKRGPSKPRKRDRSAPGPSSDLQKAASESVLGWFNAHPRAAISSRDLQKQLQWPQSKQKVIQQAVISLLKNGRLQRIKGKKLALVRDDDRLVQGTLELAEKGFGFVRRGRGEEDVYVPASKLLGAHHGDQVEIALTGAGRFGGPQGRVVRVLERNDVPVTGRFVAVPGRGGLVYPDNPRVQGPLEVPENQKRGAKDGDRVQVERMDDSRRPRGRIVCVFGPAEDPKARFAALIAQFKFREQFAHAALDEAEAADGAIPETEIGRIREDLRDLLTVTIDPESAHDFDDAISLTRHRDGTCELGVHIADVSWYVRPGGPLDKEARQRGTSVYTAHGTLPMLPERLSSNLCSLKEEEERRTVSVFMTMTSKGEVLSSRPVRSVIRSSKRFTYAQVQELIEQGRKKWGSTLPPLRSNSLAALVHHLAALASEMRAKRFREGGLNLEVPEYEVIVDEDDRPVAIERRPLYESNHLVEECMLAANRSVTEYATRERGAGAHAFVYRIHDRPDPDKLQELSATVKGLDVPWPFGKNLDSITSKQINHWLASLTDHPLAEVIRIHTLRAMAKAEYNTENIGHYGLGFVNYTHFTSPIRRYPDLVVHRILLDDLEKTAKYKTTKVETLQRTCELSSERERAAQEMERQSLRIRQAEFFKNLIGEEFEGLIVKAIAKGVFVEIEGTGAQGMILAEDLGQVYFDRSLEAFVEIGGELLYRAGSQLKVRVWDADPEFGRVELELAGSSS
ncbi:MAG: VacB/RNase II family 3'-5' exoribonuclease [bacterium]